MADWKKLAKDLLLADGKIDERETALVRQELFADNQIDDAELDFLIDLKKAAMGVHITFNQLVLDGVKRNILGDGVISRSEAEFLRRWILADGRVDPPEKKLLQELKAGARQTCPEFESLYTKCMAM